MFINLNVVNTIMTGQRILNNIRDIANTFEDGQEVDVLDISNAMYKKVGKIRWSTCEIAGCMRKLNDLFIPTGDKNHLSLNTYIVKHNL